MNVINVVKIGDCGGLDVNRNCNDVSSIDDSQDLKIAMNAHNKKQCLNNDDIIIFHTIDVIIILNGSS